MIFFNRGNRFEAAALPREAQFAPVFSVNVGDFDGDGHEDIFLSENFFANQPETPRLDAGLGLWLQGDGTEKLRAVLGHESGVKVFGEQRGAALADFNEDGRVDLVVTQNGAATCLFQNVTAKPGLRVRLVGPPGNPTGVGAMIRLKFGPRFGAPWAARRADGLRGGFRWDVDDSRSPVWYPQGVTASPDGETGRVLAHVIAITSQYAPTELVYPLTLTGVGGRWTVASIDRAPVMSTSNDPVARSKTRA